MNSSRWLQEEFINLSVLDIFFLIFLRIKTIQNNTFIVYEVVSIVYKLFCICDVNFQQV